MAKFPGSLSTLVCLVAISAFTFAMVRWGLHLPNLMVNDLVQEIVIGAAPMVSLLGLASGRVWSGRSRRRFWVGFLAFGSVALAAYVGHAYFLCRPGEHYSGNYEIAINGLLRRAGMTWEPGEHGVRYAIVIVSLVVLLALPQVLFAVLGGWLVGRRRATSEAPGREPA